MAARAGVAMGGSDGANRVHVGGAAGLPQYIGWGCWEPSVSRSVSPTWVLILAAAAGVAPGRM